MAIKIQRFFKKCVPKYVQYKNNRKNNQKIIEKYAKNWF